MWPRWGPWGKIYRGGDSSTASAAPIASFKDVHALVRDEDEARVSEAGENGSSSTAGASSRCRTASVFHRVRLATATLRTWRSLPPSAISDPCLTPVGEKKRIVVYYTSLHVIRRTFEDCRAVRSILRGFRLAVDERDLAMDSGFLSELKGIVGRRHVSLPQIFIGGRYIGGADEIRQLHESGELKLYVAGVPLAAFGVCEACGGFRFTLCPKCSGSHKWFSEKGGFRTCAVCNENGLVRCAACCAPAV
ncbi:Uncharacterized protein AXF42_Ash008327 [Apostasia shenzhenica]|uniref:Glutaredoxin domain-containing protein n=1 Tax=Apostasia shenzhenica TaxID=1088818 RepID=A0A2I0AXL1_9ASPA|nr:Uncharacterized protein AXF42_Ash008327 [Apostasia shenzhenica]